MVTKTSLPARAAVVAITALSVYGMYGLLAGALSMGTWRLMAAVLMTCGSVAFVSFVIAALADYVTSRGRGPKGEAPQVPSGIGGLVD
ncbi:hypothetical protein ACMATS_06005 [Streptoverticillium reticulum]|uniref:hypothetical protein n=1 Tax=Streptoverticillium reticulum TaxID=1433415 RepID=UPI0039BF40A3